MPPRRPDARSAPSGRGCTGGGGSWRRKCAASGARLPGGRPPTGCRATEYTEYTDSLNMDDYEATDDRDLVRALRRLNDAVVVPAPDPAREAVLMAAFDAASRQRRGVRSGRQYWFMAGLATAAAI